METRRSAVIELFKAGKCRSEIASLLSYNRMFISRTLSRFADTGDVLDRPRPGRPRTARTISLTKRVLQRIKRNPARSIRKMAIETKTNRESMRRLVCNDLRMKAYKMKKRQLLTAKNKSKRLERCKAMLSRFTNGRHKQILFSDEKLFTVQQVLNKQNHRILATDKSTLPESTFRVSRTQKPASVMVWAGVTATGRTPLIFIPQGVKINQSVYRESILENVLKPWAQSHFGNDLWIFQQDSAPAHKAKSTQKWCKTNFPGVISSEEWPPCSPDLNPLDFSIWSILEERVNATPHRSVEDLKSKLLREWSKIPDEHVCASVDSFIVRLKSCIKAKGDIFE